MKMDPELERSFNILNNRHEALLRQCKALSDDRLNQPMATGKWSVAQVTDHLHQSMEYTLNYIRKKIQTPSAIEQNRFRSLYRKLLLVAFLNTDIRFRAPKPVSVVPEYITGEKLRADADRLLSAYRSFLEEFPSTLLKKNVFKHPVAGRIRLIHTLQFMEAHVRHHQRQVNRFLNRQEAA